MPLLPEPASSEIESVAEPAPEVTSSENESARPVPEPASVEPWWLADPYLRAGAGREAKALPELLTVLEQKIEVITGAAKVSETQTAISPELVEVCEPEPATAVPEQLPVVKTQPSEPRLEQPWAPPAQSWERVTPLYETIKTIDASEKATEEPQEPEPEETSYQPASRFDGLRNLATVLGLKKLREQAAPTQPAVKSASEHDQERERSTYQRASSRASEPATANLTGTASAVIAQPEVLSSQATAGTMDTGSSGERISSAPSDSQAAQEDVVILRSRRGQY
jgi:hypothetical protein